MNLLLSDQQFITKTKTQQNVQHKMAEYFDDENELKLPTICTSQLACPLCNTKRKSFSCENCVKNGNFSHSRGKCSERYADLLQIFPYLEHPSICKLKYVPKGT